MNKMEALEKMMEVSEITEIKCIVDNHGFVQLPEKMLFAMELTPGDKITFLYLSDVDYSMFEKKAGAVIPVDTDESIQIELIQKSTGEEIQGFYIPKLLIESADLDESESFLVTVKDGKIIIEQAEYKEECNYSCPYCTFYHKDEDGGEM